MADLLNPCVYLDHHAATPIVSAAQQAMVDAHEQSWANPSSIHAAGRRSRALLERARDKVGAALGAKDGQVVLTSGGTEACNLGIVGLGRAAQVEYVLSTGIEHPAVSQAVAALAEQGELHHLPVPQGIVPTPRQLDEALADKPNALVALQWVNHETGLLLPVADYARVCARHGALLFVDGTQAVGKVPVDFDNLGADAMAVAAHKMGGPAGAGALLLARGRVPVSLILGGGQERGMRAGTQDVPQHVGFGAACDCLQDRLCIQGELRVLQNRLEDALLGLGATVNCHGRPRVTTVVNASFPGRRGERLVAALDLRGICVSSGAACSSGVASVSSVLAHMFPDAPWRAKGALRFSFGPATTEDEVDRAIAALRAILSP